MKNQVLISKLQFLPIKTCNQICFFSHQVKWNGDAGKISINGTDYKLQQCHWHSPSEHTINGKR